VQWRRINARTVAIVLAAGLVVALVVALVSGGIGKDDVPDDAVAVVDGEELTEEDFGLRFAQVATSQGLEEPPPEDDPQYDTIRNEALGQAIQEIWLEGEAAERGIEVSDREVEQQIQTVREQQGLTSEKAFQNALNQAGLTEETLRPQIKLDLLSTRIQEDLTEEAGETPDEVVEEFYDANAESFAQPETRDVRVIVNKDEAQAQEAFDRLSEDDSDENWETVARELSTDPSSKNTGGLREGVTEGTFPAEVDSAVFAASEGELEGPIQGGANYYVFRVDAVNEGGTQPFDEVREQLAQQVNSQYQQQYLQSFISDYRDLWTERTVCADDFAFELCDNFVTQATPCPDPSLPEDQQQTQLEQTGCPPPVPSRRPGEIFGSEPFVTASAVSGPLPQRPHPPGEDAAETGLPQGFPTLPGGAAPGGAAPQGAPQGAPPAAPPGG